MKILKLFSLYNVIILSIVSLPFDQLFNSAFPSFPVSPFRIITIIVAVLFFKYNLNAFSNSKTVVFLFYFYIIFSFISILWSSELGKSFSYTVQLFSLLAFFIVCVSELSKNKDSLLKLSFYASIVGGVIAQLSLLGVFSDRELNTNQRLSFVNIGVNALAISIGLFFVISIYSVIKNKSLLKKSISIIAMAIMFYFLFRTGTRSAIFGVLIALILSYPLSYKINIKGIVLYFLFGLVIYGGFNYIYNLLGDRLAQRVTSVSAEDMEENSRNKLWNIAFEYSSQNILGTGAGNERKAYDLFNEGSGEAHNVFVSAFLQLGLLGFLIITIITLVILKNILTIKEQSIKFTTLSLFIFLFLQMMKGSFLQTRLFWIPLVFIFTAIIIDDKLSFSKKHSNLLSK